MTVPILSIIIVAFLAASAFFSASETSLFSIPRERIAVYRSSPSRVRQWVYRLLSNGQRTLLMILLGNLFVNITLAGLIHSLILIFIPGSPGLLTMAIATGVIVIFGEMLPKAVALKHNEVIACLIAPGLSGISWVCSPILTFIYKINDFFLVRIRRRLHRPSPFVTVAELKSGVIDSRHRGVITAEEQDIIVSLLERGAQPVRQFMQHRSGLLMQSETANAGETLEKMKKEGQTFVLTLDESHTARVTGIVDLAALLRSEPGQALLYMKRSPVWVIDSMGIAEVIGTMLEKKSTEAGILDEHGSFCGMLRFSAGIHSMLAPVFKPADVKETGDGAARLFSGSAELESLREWIPPSLEEDAFRVRTLNGLLTRHLGRIPQTGDKFAIDGFNFYILNATPRKIESVVIRKRKNYEY